MIKRRLILLVGFACAAIAVFGMGVYIGHRKLPPFSLIVMAVRSLQRPEASATKYNEAASPGSSEPLAGLHSKQSNPRAEHFRDLLHPADVVMLGDSITQGAEWNEFFPQVQVANRGIHSETVQQIHSRLETVIQVQPNRCFVMAGINNDLGSAAAINEMISDYRRMLTELKEASIEVYVQSILHTQNSGRQKAIAETNRRLALLCNRMQGVSFLDLNGHIAPNGRMLDCFTTDGCHLNAAGYRAWAEAIRPLVESTGHNRSTNEYIEN